MRLVATVTMFVVVLAVVLCIAPQVVGQQDRINPVTGRPNNRLVVGSLNHGGGACDVDFNIRWDPTFSE